MVKLSGRPQLMRQKIGEITKISTFTGFDKKAVPKAAPFALTPFNARG
jgi:hypothetical protein